MPAFVLVFKTKWLGKPALSIPMKVPATREFLMLFRSSYWRPARRKRAKRPAFSTPLKAPATSACPDLSPVLRNLEQFVHEEGPLDESMKLVTAVCQLQPRKAMQPVLPLLKVTQPASEGGSAIIVGSLTTFFLPLAVCERDLSITVVKDLWSLSDLNPGP